MDPVVFLGELDPPSISLFSSSLPPFIPRFPLLLRHFSTEVKSGLVSLLDTQTQKNRERNETLAGGMKNTNTLELVSHRVRGERISWLLLRFYRFVSAAAVCV